MLLNNMKAKDPLVQSKAWAALAASSALPSDQFDALKMSVDVLEGRFNQAGARVDLADWLYLNRFPAEVRA